MRQQWLRPLIITLIGILFVFTGLVLPAYASPDLQQQPTIVVPTVTGTPVGLGLLAWTGLGKLLGRSPPK